MNTINADVPVKSGLRILLLDDSEFMLELVKEMLSDLGVVDVLMAQDGEQGLAIFDAQEVKPDILMCDLNMPGMDGIEFLRHVADRGYGGGVVLLSATDLAVLKAAERLALAHGLNFLGVLEKPIEEEALLAVISRSSGCARQKRSPRQVQMLTPDEVRQGIAADRIELYFQPKVSVRDRRLLGVECLARWRHPERGLLTPDTFISVVEQHGMIDAFTLAVFAKAVAQQGAWLKQGHNIKMSVNVSMDNLLRLDLPELFAKVVQDAGLDAGNIVLEMTESRLMDNVRLGLDILIRLRLKGFGLSIDDFGTGYSTMEKLKQLPFTELKIDQTFVNGAAQDASARAILESSVRLGKILQLNLVAEGVETQQDWDMVLASGCDEVHGFFVARPMPAADLLGWKAGWECALHQSAVNAL